MLAAILQLACGDGVIEDDASSRVPSVEAFRVVVDDAVAGGTFSDFLRIPAAVMLSIHAIIWGLSR